MEEIKLNEEQKVNMFDFVTIPISEYKELVTAVAKKQVRKEYKKIVKELQEDKEKYRRWWREEERQTTQLRKNLDDAKALIVEKLGVDPEEFLNKAGEDNAESE